MLEGVGGGGVQPHSKGLAMEPRQLHRGSMGILIAFSTMILTVMASCSPSGDEASPRTGSTHQPVTAQGKFTLFESGQVRPLAISPDKRYLFALNTPDNRLEVFRIQTNDLIHTVSVPVGLEPVAVAARTDREI